MKKILTEKEIRAIIRNERIHNNPYNDEVDLIINNTLSLYESKKIDEKTFKMFLSFVISIMTKQTVSSLTNDLIRKNLMNINTEEPNKLLFLNYSKKTYA